MIDLNEISTQITMKIDDGLTSPMNTDLRTDEPYDFNSLKNEMAHKKVADENLLIIYPEDDVLQIDIDNEHSYLLFTNQVMILSKFMQVQKWDVTPSKSGLPKRHITVSLGRAVSSLERLALQAMLGSDRIRELLGFVRLQQGELHPTLFFERKS